MGRGNVNPTQHLPWWLRETTKNLNQFSQHLDLNSELSEYESSVMKFDERYALCIQKYFNTDSTSLSAGAGIRASVLNCCNDANVRTREVL